MVNIALAIETLLYKSSVLRWNVNVFQVLEKGRLDIKSINLIKLSCAKIGFPVLNNRSHSYTERMFWFVLFNVGLYR